MDRMSVKQLGQTVLNGQRVTFHLITGNSITGYISGWDDDSYFVLVPTADNNEVEQWLVSKSSPCQRIHTGSTLSTEPLCDEMERIIYPFRRHIKKQNQAARFDSSKVAS